MREGRVHEVCEELSFGRLRSPSPAWSGRGSPEPRLRHVLSRGASAGGVDVATQTAARACSSANTQTAARSRELDGDKPESPSKFES